VKREYLPATSDGPAGLALLCGCERCGEEVLAPVPNAVRKKVGLRNPPASRRSIVSLILLYLIYRRIAYNFRFDSPIVFPFN
jgi:hypothetical protein